MKTRARFAFLALLLAGLSVAFLSSKELYAVSGYQSRTEWGGADAATSESDSTLGYSRSQSGATWYYYSMPSSSSKQYEDDTKLYVPFNNDYPHGPKVAIPAKTCQEYGGFWVLLRNEYNISTKALTNRPATAIKLSDVSKAGLGSFASLVANPTNAIAYINRTGTPNGENQDGVTATKYGTMNQVFGYYNTLKNTSAVPESAKNDPGNLSYFCSNSSGTVPDKAAPIQTFTTVSIENGATSAPVIDGTSYLGGYNNSNSPLYSSSSITVPIGEKLPTVVFRFYVARPYSEKDLSGSGTISSSRESASPTSLNDRTRTWNIGGTEYLYTEVASQSYSTGTMGNRQTTYCQSINDVKGSYNIADFKFNSSGQSRSSTACVTFVPIPANAAGELVTDCNAMGDGRYKSTSRLGNTVATVGVSKNRDPVQITTAAPANTTVKVYAKPGDSVRFSYAICFGANSVTGGPSGQGYATSTNKRSDAVFTSFQVFPGIYSERDGTKLLETGSKYVLFAPWNNSLIGETITIGNGAMRNQKRFKFYFGTDPAENADGDRYEITSPFWDSTNNQISFASPDPRSGAGHVDVADGSDEDINIDDTDGFDDYSCAYYTGIAGSTLTGYYLPGFDGLLGKELDCGSAEISDGKQTSVVGATINQTLQYTYTAAWPSSSNRYESNLQRAITAYNAAYDSGGGSGGGRTVTTGSGKSGNFEIYKTGSVVVPYNFKINLTGEVTNHDSAIVYAGDILEYKGHIDVLPRENPLSSDRDGDNLVPYATTMPSNTRVEIVEFLIQDGANLDSIKDKLKQGYLPPGELENSNLAWHGRSYSTREVCEYYQNILGSDFGDCKSRIVMGTGAETEADQRVGNSNSDPEGEMNYYNNKTEKLVVPDVKAGYKYCTALAINYGDSHGVPISGFYSDTLTTDENSPAFAANAASVNNTLNTAPSSFRWYGTNVTCKTVAKKPSFETWNSGVFSDDNITSSTTKKSVNARLGNFTPGTKVEDLPKNRGYTENDIAPNDTYFGSWAEYYVVAKGTVSGFASASALGYNRTFGSLSSDGYGQTTPANLDQPNYCDLSRLTIANVNCKSEGTAGKFAGTETIKGIDVTNGKNLRKTVVDFYTPPEFADNSWDYLVYANTLSGVNFNNLKTWRGAQMIYTNGPFTIDQTLMQSSGTLVIRSDGHVNIKANICLGTGTCANAENLTGYQNSYVQDTNNLSLLYRNEGLEINSGNLAAVPQVIIIAKSISIDSEVSQVDAWLVTYSNDPDYDGGYVNTCDGFQDGKTSTESCWKTLKINGPIITTALLLNRTGGAWPGYSGDVGNQAYDTLIIKYGPDAGKNLVDTLKEWKADCKGRATETTTEKTTTNCINEKIEAAAGGDQNLLEVYKAADRYAAQMNIYQAGNSYFRDLTCGGSITPAEILDLHPLVYLWAYAQSLRLGQATINYAQELAPRY